ncbi:MAG: FtsX-like permease family protein, partial [Terriglobales bacterium]
QGLAAVVNQTFTREFFPGQDPIGQRFKASYGAQWLTIKGVAKDVPIFGLGEANIAQVYLPSTTLGVVHVIVRSRLPQAQVDAAIRAAVASLDSTLPVYSLRSMDEVANEAVGAQAFEKWLVAGFAGLALLLSAAGIYGVMAFLVGARTREIGVRMALGARRGDVIGMVLGRGLAVAAVGCGIGVAAALASGSVLASQLYEVKPQDPAILMAAVAVLVFTTLAACALPARRAAGVDPNQALRQQ